MKLSELTLQTKADIPFEPAKIIIHQPSLKQIGMIREDLFWLGSQYLNFSKNLLKQQDKVRLESLSDFEVLMTMMRSQNSNFEIQKTAMLLVLTLLFPDCGFDLLPISIRIRKQGEQDRFIDRGNFDQFKSIVSQIFCLDELTNGGDRQYNPQGPMAEMLAQKFRQRRAKLAEIKNQGEEDQSIHILSKYISILAVGQYKNKNELSQYSIFQLMDEYRRFMLREEYNIIFKIKLAGGKDVKDAQDWMKDIHSGADDF